MVAFLLKLLSFSLVSVFVAISYYRDSTFHREAFAGSYATYALLLLLAYGCYKGWQLFRAEKSVTFSPASLFGYALAHIVILSSIFFSLNGWNGGTFLFLKMIGFLFLPIALGLIFVSTGKWIKGQIGTDASDRVSFLLSFWLWFTAYSTFLSILAFVGQFNTASISILSIAFATISYREMLDTLKSLFRPIATFDGHGHGNDGEFLNGLQLRLLSAEFFFIVITLLIGTNFINVVRPMPIGWDDLGVYMNWPKLIAMNGSALDGAGMFAWQIVTAIGFAFGSATQAFFLNQLGGIFSIILLTYTFSQFFDRSNKKSLVHLPLLGATIFYAMPMVIFQQGKDMKLDPALFSISIAGIGALFMYLEERWKDLWTDTGAAWNGHLRTLGAIGVIIGMAFVIKLTSLMLILGAIGVLFFNRLWMAGLIGYFAAFVGIFTKFGLWWYMNVSYPQTDTGLINTVSTVTLIVSALSFAYAVQRHKQDAVVRLSQLFAVFMLGILLPMIPWFAKNLSEVRGNSITIGSLLNGEFRNAFVPEYTKIYDTAKLKAIVEKNSANLMTSSGKSQNEDLGRYFGYEDGINNYVKLPVNLTLQKNQRGEFTDITYLYLALFPILLIFLPFKNVLGYVVIGAGILFAYGSNYNDAFSVWLTGILAGFTLPGGYLPLVLGLVVPPALFLLSMKWDDGDSAKSGVVLITIYWFLFILAAFGIVWYGIALYYLCLLLSLFGAKYMLTLEDSQDEKEQVVKFFAASVFLAVTCTYFFMSSIPHAFTNLKSAGFTEFKNGSVNEEEGVFTSHPDYFPILAALNLKDQDAVIQKILGQLQKDGYLDKLIRANLGSNGITMAKLERFLTQAATTDLATPLGLDAVTGKSINAEARELRKKLYVSVLYPDKEGVNNAPIYRIGTFLTYFIANNRSRYMEDSLIMQFDQYMYNKDPDVTADSLKKLGIKYLLMDLNAATIDQDPRHDLTRRYENLLNSVKSDKLRLVESDSPCLKLALAEKNEEYLTYAGVNYESYAKDGSQIPRSQKLMKCYSRILELIQKEKVTKDSYAFLMPLSDYIKRTNPKTQEEVVQIFQNYVGHGWMALFEVK